MGDGEFFLSVVRILDKYCNSYNFDVNLSIDNLLEYAEHAYTNFGEDSTIYKAKNGSLLVMVWKNGKFTDAFDGKKQFKGPLPGVILFCYGCTKTFGEGKYCTECKYNYRLRDVTLDSGVALYSELTERKGDENEDDSKRECNSNLDPCERCRLKGVVDGNGMCMRCLSDKMPMSRPSDELMRQWAQVIGPVEFETRQCPMCNEKKVLMDAGICFCCHLETLKNTCRLCKRVTLIGLSGVCIVCEKW